MEGRVREKRVFTGKVNQGSKNSTRKEWKKPTLEDVSGRVMAQPYIRFT